MDDFDNAVEELEARSRDAGFYPPVMDALYNHQVDIDDDGNTLAGGRQLRLKIIAVELDSKSRKTSSTYCPARLRLRTHSEIGDADWGSKMTTSKY